MGLGSQFWEKGHSGGVICVGEKWALLIHQAGEGGKSEVVLSSLGTEDGWVGEKSLNEVRLND